jgi:UDP-galactose transporter B1
MQEEVFSFEDAQGKKFTQAWFLQAIEALANVIVGFLGMMVTGRTVGLPLDKFALSGATQVAAKACTSLALANGLSFPVATLAKSAKMAPVMAGSILLGGKKYSLRSYLQVGSIIAATVMVSMNKKSKPGQTSSLLGVLFICSSLMLDGVTGGVQDALKTKCKDLKIKAKPYDMMFWTNFFMMVVGALAALCLGEFATGIAFILANPAILSKVLAFGACSAIGQSFIFFVVSEYGPLKNPQ